jgi:Glycosyltransferase family 87
MVSVFIIQRNMKKIIHQNYGLIAVALLCVFYTFKAIDFPIHDFANYYFGGQFLANGTFNSDTYFPYLFNKQIADLGYSGIFANYAPNTPFLALIFAPFSLLSLTTAKLIFNLISVVLFMVSIYRLSRFYSIKSIYILFIPLLFLVPIRNELLFGQVYFFLFFFLSEFWLAYQKEKHLKSTIFLSLAILLKVFPVLLLVIFLFKKEFKPLLYTFVFGFLLFGISVFFTGFDVWFFWLNSVVSKASNGEIANSFVDNYQSVFMFLKRLFIYNNAENPHPFFHADNLFLAVVFAFKIGILTLGYFITTKKSNSLLVFSYWILAVILLSPYGSTYTFILLLFPFLALVKSAISNIKKAILLLILLMINNLPLSLFLAKSFPFSYLRLFLLLAFVITFVVLLFQKSSWIKTIGFSAFVLFIGSFFWKAKPEKSSRFFSVQNPILMYDYEIKNKQLIYFYWNEKGENQKSIKLCKSDFVTLKIKNNQIFYGNQQLTFDNNNKLKPILLNKKLVVYLSDYDRGIGFYSLRKIKLK